jgi:hypothetical protein
MSRADNLLKSREQSIPQKHSHETAVTMSQAGNDTGTAAVRGEATDGENNHVSKKQ